MTPEEATMRNDEMEAVPPPDPGSGIPGDGRGRRDLVGGSGVYPASTRQAPPGAVPRTQAEWGQGDRGAAGYDDSGRSGIFFLPAQLPEEPEMPRGDRVTSPPAAEGGGHPGVAPLTHEEIEERRSKGWGGW
jgi:hypothetical protein